MSAESFFVTKFRMIVTGTRVVFSSQFRANNEAEIGLERSVCNDLASGAMVWCVKLQAPVGREQSLTILTIT